MFTSKKLIPTKLFMRRSSQTLRNFTKHTLPDLPYDYNALEPVISAEIMQLHHQKHHAAYVNALNDAEQKSLDALEGGDFKKAIALQSLLKFNGGGHINHSILWTNLSKDGSEPSRNLAQAIERDFGSVENMQQKLNALCIAHQGSGWGWLCYCPQRKILKVTTCINQDPLEPTTGLIPLFGIDVWEHAFYLQYKNVKADYVKAIWKIANWKNIDQRFQEAQNQKP